MFNRYITTLSLLIFLTSFFYTSTVYAVDSYINVENTCDKAYNVEVYPGAFSRGCTSVQTKNITPTSIATFYVNQFKYVNWLFTTIKKKCGYFVNVKEGWRDNDPNTILKTQNESNGNYNTGKTVTLTQETQDSTTVACSPTTKYDSFF